MLKLSLHFPDKRILGLEIRDKVVDYVAEKIHAIQHNSDGKLCANVAVINCNAMKTITRYCEPNSVSISM